MTGRTKRSVGAIDSVPALVTLRVYSGEKEKMLLAESTNQIHSSTVKF